MKLGGWTRLAIVVSVVWVVAVGVVVAAQVRSATPDALGSFVHYVPGTVVEKSVTLVNKEGKATTGDVVWDVPAVKWSAVLPFLLWPLALIWLFIPLVVSIFRWVKAGFKSAP